MVFSFSWFADMHTVWVNVGVVLCSFPPHYITNLFKPFGQSGEYHQSFRGLVKDHRLTWRSCCVGGGGRRFETWTMVGETERGRERCGQIRSWGRVGPKRGGWEALRDRWFYECKGVEGVVWGNKSREGGRKDGGGLKGINLEQDVLM